MNKLKFIFNEEKSDERFEFYECERGNCRISIIKANEGNMCSVFVKNEITGDLWWKVGYVELASHKATTVDEAKEVAEKLYEKILQINLD